MAGRSSIQSKRAERLSSFIALPGSVSNNLENSLLDEFARSLTPELVDEVQQLSQHDRPLNYGKHAASFAYLYFGANYSKAYISCKAVISKLPRKRLRVLDLGCGSGASSAAIVTALVEHGFQLSELCG